MPSDSPNMFDLTPDYSISTRVSEQGTVVSVGDGIIWVKGLPSAMMDEVIYLEDGSTALVFLLDPEKLGAIVLEQKASLSSGISARRSGRRLDISIGDQVLGRVLDPLGRPLDGKAPPPDQQRGQLEVNSPAILDRNFVSSPLYTGNRIIDSQIPIGKGQRQLIIGDNGLGKTSLAVDTILRQQGEGVNCIYVSIGQTRSSVATLIDTLQEQGGRS